MNMPPTTFPVEVTKSGERGDQSSALLIGFHEAAHIPDNFMSMAKCQPASDRSELEELGGMRVFQAPKHPILLSAFDNPSKEQSEL